MQSLLSIFKLAPQCCDAFTYVYDGQNCALSGICSNSLRPQGTFYWFSIPLRFGLPLNSLVYFNVLLMAASVVFSTIAFRRLFLDKQSSGRVNIALTILLAAGNLAIHLVFQYPTLFHTLTDAPSSSLFLIGCWLLLLTIDRTRNFPKAAFSALGGLSLGLAAWLRAFYLYPVLAGLAIYIIYWVINRRRTYCELFILFALLPIGSQYLRTFHDDGDFSYLGARARYFIDMHANVNSAGYDTVLPADGYHWPPRHCTAYHGMTAALEAREFSQAACLAGERLYFYLGTYEQATFRPSHQTNLLAFAYIEHPGEPVGWWLSHSKIEPDSSEAPDHTQGADRIMEIDDSNGSILKPIWLEENTPYTFSAWLWSSTPTLIEISIIKNLDKTVIASRQVVLSTKPQQYSLFATTNSMPDFLPGNAVMESTQYSVNLKFVPDGSNEPEMHRKSFYIWNAQLEMGARVTGYHSYQYPSPDEVRRWRPSLLLMNMVAMALVLNLVIIHRRMWVFQGAGGAVLVALLVTAAACIDIIPEQRFAITPLIAIWLLAVIMPLSMASSFLTRRNNPRHSEP